MLALSGLSFCLSFPRFSSPRSLFCTPARVMLLLAAAAVGFAPAVQAQTALFSGATTTLSSGFNHPLGVAVDGQGNIFVADPGNNAVKEIVAVSGQIPANPTINVLGSGFNRPSGVAVDGQGDVFVADLGNNAVKEIVAVNGQIPANPTINVLGSGFSQPSSVAVDGQGNVFVADPGNNAVKEILASGYTSTISIGATTGNFSQPSGVAVDGQGNVYVADTYNDSVKEILAVGGYVTVDTLVSGLDQPSGVAVDSAHNVYVANPFGGTVVVDSAASAYATVVTLGSNFSGPTGVAVDSSANVYVADYVNNAVYEIEWPSVNFFSEPVGTKSGKQTLTFTLAGGTIGVPQVLTMGVPNLDFIDAGTGSCTTNGTSHTYIIGNSCTVDVTFTPTRPGTRNGAVELTNSSGAVIATAYIYGTGNGPQVAFGPGTITTVAGNRTGGYGGDGGPAAGAELYDPTGVALDGAGNIYIADYVNSVIRKVSATTGVITTVAGNRAAGSGYSGDGGPATNAQLSFPWGVAVDGAGNIYIADFANNAIRKVSTATGVITTVAGNRTGGYSGDGGTATGAQLHSPLGVAVDGAGNIYFADYANNVIRKVSATWGVITTVAGNGIAGHSGDGGAATSAQLEEPYGVAVDSIGNLYVADSYNRVIRKVDAATSIITTVAGNGTAGHGGDGGPATSAQLYDPIGVAVDGTGNIYIADTLDSSTIRRVSAATGIIATIAGHYNETSTYGGDGGPATSAELYDPSGVAVDSTGNFYIADYGNNIIRKVDVATAPSLSLASTYVGSTSSDSPWTVTLENIGDAPLSFPVPSTGNNPSIAANFTLDNVTTCPMLNTSSPAAAMASGASCTLAVDFEPTSPGSISGSLLIMDNNLNASPSATQTISLSGTGIAIPTATTVIVSASLTQNHAWANFTPVTGAGGTAPLTYSVSPALPAGLSMNSATGAITGTPTVASVATTYTVTVTDANSQTGLASFSLTVNGAVTTTLAVASESLTYNSAANFTPVIGAGGTASLSYSVAPGLPPGLSFNSSTGAVNGRPTAVSAATSYTVTVTDANGGTATASFSLGVNKATSSVSWTAPSSITYGTALSAVQLNATASVSGSFSYTPALGTVLTAGTHTLTATFTPTDATDYSTPQPVTSSITVTQATLTVTANSATRLYGTPNPAFTGRVTGTMNGESFTANYTTTATQSSNVGTYTIVPSVNGPTLGNYTVQSTDGTLTISQTASTTSLSASSSSLTPGQSLTLTTQVASATTGTPTGTVSFYDGTTLLGTSTLSSRAASYTTSTLAPGVNHEFTASYEGDRNFSASSSSSAVSVPVAALDFTMIPGSRQSQTVIPGAAATYSFNISPSYGTYPSQVIFTAAGLPPGATASFSPATIAANGGAQTVTLTVQTASSSAKNSDPFTRQAPLALGFLLLPLLGLPRMRRGLLLMLIAAATLSGLTALSGCGVQKGFNSQLSENYTLNITATSGQVVHSFDVTLNLQ